MRALLIAVVVALGVSVSAQGQAPNRKGVVEAVSAADPARFACAHVEGRGCKSDWIKAVAWALHQEDPRWGLNGKRGNPNDISMDVVTFRIGPTDRHVQAFDICGACGGGSPSVVWNDITNWTTIGQAGTAVWIQPMPVSGTPPPTGAPPAPTPVPAPAPSVDLKPLLDRIAALETLLIGKIDAVAATAAGARDLAEQANTNASDIKNVTLPAAVQEIKAVPIVIPCMRGSVYGRGVRFCPES